MHWPARPTSKTPTSFFGIHCDRAWLESQIKSIDLAADFLAGLTSKEGVVRGAGYYVERPTRFDSDGVTQCHAVDAFRRVAALNRVVGHQPQARRYDAMAERITQCFRSKFWIKDHFAEYLHPKRGLIANHGLTDVDWAAIATGVVTPQQRAILWPQLKDEKLFHYGGMPTGIATLPESYEGWEFANGPRPQRSGRRWDEYGIWKPGQGRNGRRSRSVGRPSRRSARGEATATTGANAIIRMERAGPFRRC